MVVISHSFVLVGITEPGESLFGMNPGNFAVDLFFLTSGFLVTKSLLTRQNLAGFITARALRIYPGLIVVTSLTVVAAALFGNPALLFDPETAEYAIRHSVPWLAEMSHNILPEIFQSNALHEVNGPLWSLPYELRMYAALVVIGIAALGMRAHKQRFVQGVVIALAVVGLLTSIGLSRVAVLRPFATSHTYLMTKLTFMFFTGATYYVARHRVVISGKLAITVLLILILSAFNFRAFSIVYPLTLGYLLFSAAYLVKAWRPSQDHSYGVYIYGWPIQQAVIAMTHTASPLVVLLLSAPVVSIAAALSWNFVEKPAQGWRHRVARARSAEALD